MSASQSLTGLRLIVLVAVLLGGLARGVHAQTATLTFRPGPGANDGSDAGSLTAGKGCLGLAHR
jgi:hypothetical protein